MADDRPGLRRRDFLRQGLVSTLGVGALGLGAGTALGAEGEPHVRRYKKLGHTGIEIPDISIGSGAVRDPALFSYAYDRGITYFDTAESYPLKQGGEAEKALGIAFASRRDKVVITTKVHAGPEIDRNQLMRRLHASLRRLRSDYVDIYLNHGVNDPARLKNPEWPEFVSRAKQAGKIRFTGMSGHGGLLIECLDYALDHDMADVILAAHNFGQDPKFYERFTKRFDLIAIQPDLPRVLEKAHAKGVGVLVMKTLMGAKLNDMRPYEWGGATFAQAAFRWVLANPNVDGIVVSMKTRAMIDEYLGASGQAGTSAADLNLLRQYALAHSASYCRRGCNACEDRCPSGVSISEVLRTRMYDLDYGEPEMARAAYAELGAGASACLGCSGEPCRGACPNGLPIADMTRVTARRLGIS